MCLSWNFVRRALDIVTTHLHHLVSTNDYLSVFLAHMKNNQKIDRKRDPRYIYTNPHTVLVFLICTCYLFIHI